MNIDEFNDFVTYVLDQEIPPIILEGLNLGVIVSPDIKTNKDEPHLIVMGVYIQSKLGKQIILYYGSFQHFYENKSPDTWKKKIIKTIKHELTHHLEALAGQEDLAKKEKYEAHLRKLKKGRRLSQD